MRIESPYATSSRALDISTASTEVAQNSGQKSQFLQLLVAQLQHQDPLSPQDSSAFVAQLAQFTAVEQGQAMTASLDNIQLAIQSQERAGYTDLVGKTVTAKPGTIHFPMKDCQLKAHLDGDAKEVTVAVKNANGDTVRTIKLEKPIKAGDFEINWDGKNDAGVDVGEGEFTFEVSAKSDTGTSVSAFAFVEGVVSALEFLQGGVNFKLGSQSIGAGDISSVSQTREQSI